MRLRLVLGSALLLVAFTSSAQLVTSHRSSPAVVVPAMGSVQGGNGLFFRSDATFFNMKNAPQLVRFDFLTSTGALLTRTVEFTPERGGWADDDFLQTYLGWDGFGALVATAVTPSGAPDPEGQLFLTTRIWSNVPGGKGTTSQQFNAVPLAEAKSLTGYVIYGNRRDAQYRTNLGIVNLDSRNESYTVFVRRDGGSAADELQLAVPAMSFRQFPLTGDDSSVALQIIVWSNDPTHQKFLVYGSSVDKDTGDAWSTLGTPYGGDEAGLLRLERR